VNWGLEIGPNPQSPIPNPQSPIPINFAYVNFDKFISINIKNIKNIKNYISFQ